MVRKSETRLAAKCAGGFYARKFVLSESQPLLDGAKGPLWTPANGVFSPNLRRIKPPTPVPNRRVPAGAPEWVTPDLIERTINVFQPKYNEPLTPELSLEIILNTVHLFDLLTEE